MTDFDIKYQLPACTWHEMFCTLFNFRWEGPPSNQSFYLCQKDDFFVDHIFHLLSHTIFSSIHLLYVKRQTSSKQEFWTLFRNRLVAVYQGLSEQSQLNFFQLWSLQRYILFFERVWISRSLWSSQKHCRVTWSHIPSAEEGTNLLILLALVAG